MAISRSENMSRIRGKNTGPELRLRKALWAAGLRYRKHARTPVGRPDVVFPGPKTAVFIDGCFWHGCPTHYVRPGSRADFWADKLLQNHLRDQRQTLQLEAEGWKVLRCWEHEVYENLDQVVERIRRAVRDGQVDTREEWRVVRVDVLDPTTRLEKRWLELLRDPNTKKQVEGRRITRKWRRPRD